MQETQLSALTETERLAQGADHGLRPRFVRVCLLIGIVFLVVFATLDWSVGNYAIAIVDLALLPVLLGSFLYLHISGNEVVATRTALMGFFAWFLLLIPLDPLYVVWMPAFPLLAIFALGKRDGMGVAWVFIFAMCVGSIAVWQLGYSPLDFLHIITSLAALLFITVIAFFYQKRIETYQQRIAEQAATEIHAEAERRRLSERLEHVRRMESVGLLAAGIAHDFNNLLVGVLGHAELLALDLPDDDPRHKQVEEIIRSARRGSALVSQMLAYAGKGKFEIRPVALECLVEETVRLLRALFGSGVRVRCTHESGLPTIKGDRNQLGQIVMNLLTNAADALGNEGGENHIRTGRVNLNAAQMAGMLLNEVPAGEYVFMEVSDTGCGMDEATRARIFDPFFTSKKHGTGLGLSAMLGIVRAHRGNIFLESTQGEGTRFVIYLPVDGTCAPEEATPSRAVEDASLRGTVLVVDDEETVRDVTKKMLERSELSVLTVEDGESSVEMFRQQADNFSLVILDLTMPGMNGEEVFRSIRSIRADVPILFASGHAKEDVMCALTNVGNKGTAFIRKPFTRKELLEKVRFLLDVCN